MSYQPHGARHRGVRSAKDKKMTDTIMIDREKRLLRENLTRLNLDNAKLAGEITYLQNAFMNMEHKMADLKKRIDSIEKEKNET